MSVLFGSLISSFVAIGQLHSGSTYIIDEDLQAIAAKFRHNARLDHFIDQTRTFDIKFLVLELPSSRFSSLSF